MLHTRNISIDTTPYVNWQDTSLAVVGTRKDKIIEIRFKQERYEVDTKEQMEIHDAFLQLTHNGKDAYHILVIPGKYGGITKEAREMEMFATAAFKNQLSLNIVMHGLTQRIFGKLYLQLKKKKPGYPSNFYNSEELAIKSIRKKISNI